LVAVAALPQGSIQAEGPKCPPNETTIIEGRPFNISLPPVIEIFPNALRSDIVIVGLNTLWTNISVNLLTTTVDFHIKLPSVDLKCDDYSEVVGWIDATPLSEATLPSGNFTGKGAASLKAAGVELKARAVLFVNLISNKITCRELTVENLVFTSLSADLGQDYLIGPVGAGKPIDWAAWSRDVKANFEKDWATSQAAIVEKVRLGANNILEDMTLQDLIGVIDPDDCEQN
jgi:hypothetical protein